MKLYELSVRRERLWLLQADAICYARAMALFTGDRYSVLQARRDNGRPGWRIRVIRGSRS